MTPTAFIPDEAGDRENAFTTIERERNVLTVLSALRTGGAQSRLDLARETGLSKPTVSAALRLFEGGGVVRPVGYASGGRGPKASLYTIDARSVLVLGLAIGSRFLRVVAADLQGSVKFEEDIPLAAPDFDSLMDAVSTARLKVQSLNGTFRLAVAGAPASSTQILASSEALRTSREWKGAQCPTSSATDSASLP